LQQKGAHKKSGIQGDVYSPFADFKVRDGSGRLPSLRVYTYRRAKQLEELDGFREYFGS